VTSTAPATSTLRSVGRREHAGGEREAEHADRHVDQEDPSPAQRLGQRAADEEAQRAAGHADEHVAAHRPGALGVVRELGRDDREDDRRRGGAPGSLEEPRDDQRRRRGRQPAQDRGDGEAGQAGQEDPPAPEQIPEPAEQQEQAAERDQVRVRDPGQAGGAHPEVGLDRREGDVHDGRVEDQHELPEQDGEQPQHATPRCVAI
jgi:hypothetical protein